MNEAITVSADGSTPVGSQAEKSLAVLVERASRAESLAQEISARLFGAEPQAIPAENRVKEARGLMDDLVCGHGDAAATLGRAIDLLQSTVARLQ